MYNIYSITNLNNDKIYIGQTSKSIKRRWKGHVDHYKEGRKTYLCNAFRKYGINSFIIAPIAECLTKEEANHLERLWIICLRSNEKKYGYNLTLGGEGTVGYHPTPETMEKWRKAQPPKKEWTMEMRDALAIQKRGVKRPWTPEWKEKLRQARKRRNEKFNT